MYDVFLCHSRIRVPQPRGEDSLGSPALVRECSLRDVMRITRGSNHYEISESVRWEVEMMRRLYGSEMRNDTGRSSSRWARLPAENTPSGLCFWRNSLGSVYSAVKEALTFRTVRGVS